MQALQSDMDGGTVMSGGPVACKSGGEVMNLLVRGALQSRMRGWTMETHRTSAIGSRRILWLGLICLCAFPTNGLAADCPVNHDQLVAALKKSVKPSGGPGNGGFDNHQWGTVVARDGTVCAIAFTGNKPDDQWPG